jgi:hypothetical protein
MQFIKQKINAILSIFGYELHIIKQPFHDADLNPYDQGNIELLSKHFTFPIKLHFGISPRVLKGWINIDLKHEHFAGYIIQISTILPKYAVITKIL